MGLPVIRVLPTSAVVAQGLQEAVVALDRRNMAPILAEAGIAFPEEKRRKSFEVEGVFVMAFEADGALAGYLEICPDWEHAEDLYVSSVQIVPGRRHGMTFGRLVAEAIVVLEGQPFRRLRTSVQKDNREALTLYRQMGFGVEAGAGSKTSLRLVAERRVLDSPWCRRLRRLGGRATWEREDWEFIDADCPCAVCDYNLRGLRVGGRCPECGAAIERTMRRFREQVVCTACMTPNSALVQACSNCGAPLGLAGPTAEHFRQMPAMCLAEEGPEAGAGQTETGRRHSLTALWEWLWLLVVVLVAGLVLAALMALPLLLSG